MLNCQCHDAPALSHPITHASQTKQPQNATAQKLQPISHYRPKNVYLLQVYGLTTLWPLIRNLSIHVIAIRGILWRHHSNSEATGSISPVLRKYMYLIYSPSQSVALRPRGSWLQIRYIPCRGDLTIAKVLQCTLICLCDGCYHTHHRMSPQLNNEQMIEPVPFLPTTIHSSLFISYFC